MLHPGGASSALSEKIYFKVVLVLSCLPHVENSGFVRAQSCSSAGCSENEQSRVRSGDEEVRLGLCALGDPQGDTALLEALLWEVLLIWEITWMTQTVMTECEDWALKVLFGMESTGWCCNTASRRLWKCRAVFAVVAMLGSWTSPCSCFASLMLYLELLVTFPPNQCFLNLLGCVPEHSASLQSSLYSDLLPL